MSDSKREDKLEALDFVLGVLEKDVKDLGRIVKDLEKTAESLDKLNELTTRIEAVEREVTKHLSQIPSPASPSSTAPTTAIPQAGSVGPSYTLSFRIWEEFKLAAKDADFISFNIVKDDVLEISAQKEARLFRYQGKLPRGGRIIKSWLARELRVDDERIVEGEITLTR